MPVSSKQQICLKDYKELRLAPVVFLKVTKMDKKEDEFQEVLKLILPDKRKGFNGLNDVIAKIKERLDNNPDKQEIEDFLSKIEDIADLYNKGNMHGAIQKTQELILNDKGEPLVCSNRSENFKEYGLKRNWYRMRHNEAFHLYDKKDMFHVPATLRNIVADQRYSCNGFPCLYLGASLYDCWEETRRKELERMNYVAYKFVGRKPLHVLDIDMPDKSAKDVDSMKRLVFFVLCSMEVSNDKHSFKYEYELPELVLHALIKYNHENKDVQGFKPYDGIRYLSSRYFSKYCLFRAKSIMWNLVLLIREYDEEGLSIHLCNDFRISEVSALYHERVSGHTWGHPLFSRPHSYVESLFYKIEEDLKSKKFERIKWQGV